MYLPCVDPGAISIASGMWFKGCCQHHVSSWRCSSEIKASLHAAFLTSAAATEYLEPPMLRLLSHALALTVHRQHMYLTSASRGQSSSTLEMKSGRKQHWNGGPVLRVPCSYVLWCLLGFGRCSYVLLGT